MGTTKTRSNPQQHRRSPAVLTKSIGFHCSKQSFTGQSVSCSLTNQGLTDARKMVGQAASCKCEHMTAFLASKTPEQLFMLGNESVLPRCPTCNATHTCWTCLECCETHCTKCTMSRYRHEQETGHTLSVSPQGPFCYCVTEKCQKHIRQDPLKPLFEGVLTRYRRTITPAVAASGPDLVADDELEALVDPDSKFGALEHVFDGSERVDDKWNKFRDDFSKKMNVIVAGIAESLHSNPAERQLLDSAVGGTSEAVPHDTPDLTEYFDEPAALEASIEAVAEHMRTSNRIVFFTGTGISTSANIPDYRGPKGVWTLRDKGHKLDEDALGKQIAQAKPTMAHKCIAAFEASGSWDNITVASTNVDGLHRKAATASHADSVIDLHGNSFLEVCEECQTSYTRDYRVAKSFEQKDCKICKKVVSSGYCHCTGRTCEQEGCNGRLVDTIIQFGEGLVEEKISKAFKAAESADLCIVVGTSARVAPSAQIPRLTHANGGKVVVINLQNTPVDAIADNVIHARTDDVFSRLACLLGVQVP